MMPPLIPGVSFLQAPFDPLLGAIPVGSPAQVPLGPGGSLPPDPWIVQLAQVLCGCMQQCNIEPALELPKMHFAYGTNTALAAGPVTLCQPDARRLVLVLWSQVVAPGVAVAPSPNGLIKDVGSGNIGAAFGFNLSTSILPMVLTHKDHGWLPHLAWQFAATAAGQTCGWFAVYYDLWS